EIFERQARKTPEAVALTCGEAAWTYRQLNERANQIAHFLRRLGVGRETCVALYLERSLNMVAAILGVLKAGGAYLPIDLAYPAERLEFMVEDSQAPVLLTQESLSARVPAGISRVLCVDSEWPTISAEPVLNPVNVTTPNNLAYVIYTSGSTGKP